MWADPVVTRYIGGSPLSREEVWSRILRYVGHWALLGYGFWAVGERSGGAFVGELGFADFHRELHPPLTAPELGWALASAMHGRGYATEALGACLAWSEPRFPATCCLIDRANAPSLRVATKLGFGAAGEVLYRGTPLALLTRERRASS